MATKQSCQGKVWDLHSSLQGDELYPFERHEQWSYAQTVTNKIGLLTPKPTVESNASSDPMHTSSHAHTATDKIGLLTPNSPWRATPAVILCTPTPIHARDRQDQLLHAQATLESNASSDMHTGSYTDTGQTRSAR
ncbi:MAG: hypothetical protein HETSPECPRED_007371 [Heterodermia speciosa]|uniref:Uncharacterized protein n=1 Tax=Heterodermia speciosa TaxID=116794 RepID=A0A8H3FNV4_9LECA|nr:MAG: hypothetical protein HETSPECPRED_007371 [Heterodermia speciosa]